MKRFILILLFCIAALLHGQTLHWDTAGVDLGTHATITIGDQLNLVAQASRYPTPDEFSQNDIILLSMHFDSSCKNAIYVATSFEEGEHHIALGDSDSLLLTVLDVPNVDTSTTYIKDIADIMREPYTFWEIFRWVLLVLIIGILIWLIIFITRRIKQHQPIVAFPEVPALPPHTIALNNLEQLRQKELWPAGRLKEYYTELTDIVRLYLSSRFGIESMEMTSDQTLDAYDEIRSRDESYGMLRDVLRTADMVKFAKAEPQSFEHDIAMKNARTFVESTTDNNIDQ